MPDSSAGASLAVAARAPTSAEEACVLVVDDDDRVRRAACRALEHAGYVAYGAATGKDARNVLDSFAIDAALLDIDLPDRNGLELLDEFARRWPTLSVIMLTASSSRADALESIRRGADGYVRKPFDVLTLEVQVGAALQRRRRDAVVRSELGRLEAGLRQSQLLLEEIPDQFAGRLTHSWDLRHGETGAHVRRIARYAELVGQTLGLARDRVRSLGCAAMLHDIGKIAIPDAILCKPGPLTAAEFDVMKLHPKIGSEMLSDLDHPLFRLASAVARHHHERWDGSGYPDHLRGSDCPIEARIVATVDVFDALTQTRCYKEAWSEERVVSYLHVQSGRLFEGVVVDALLSNLPGFRAIAAAIPDSPARPLVAE